MSWDIYSKLLLKECPQDFVTYFVPGARFVRMRESQFQTRADGPYDPREMRGDIMIEAEYQGRHFLINVEWQSSKDEEMDMRLLGYCYESMRLHKLPVLSIVIYLQSVSDVPQAPLVKSIPTGRQIVWFDFESLEIHEQAVEQFRTLDLDAFYVLMLLCKDGARRDILEEILVFLQEHGRKELVSVVRFFAGKVFPAKEDREQLERRFDVLREFFEDSWTFQQTIEEGRVKGLAQGIEQGIEQGIKRGIEQGIVQGLEEGLEQGVAQGQRQSIEIVTQARFPDLLVLVKNRISFLTDEEKLQKILSVVSAAHSSEEVRHYLLALR